MSEIINSVALRELIRPVSLSILACILIWVLIWIVYKEIWLSAIITTFILFFFFSYGRAYLNILKLYILRIFSFDVLIINPHIYLLPVWILLLIVCIWIIVRLKHYSYTISNALNLIAIMVVMIPIFRIAKFEYTLHNSALKWLDELPKDEIYNSSGFINKPDIYYIILDGYGRSDLLNEIYKYDNSSFLRYLKDKGFYIADQSKSNYIQSVLSLSSSLNMSYLDFTPDLLVDSSDRSALSHLIRWSFVRRFLENRGYKTVTFSTGYRATELENADVFLHSPSKSVTQFEKLIMDTSALVLINEFRRFLGLTPYFPGYTSHSDRIEFAFDTLSGVHQIEGPKFVFAHIIAPHPPFVFDEMGNLVSQKYPFYLMDGSAYLGTTDEYVLGYRGQIQYIDFRMQKVIDSILGNSKGEPIIIVQADHGPGSGFNWDSPDEMGIRERVSILNAYYFPEHQVDNLYETITPVNTFRVIFNEYFGTGFALLPDRSYHSSWNEPYKFEIIQ